MHRRTVLVAASGVLTIGAGCLSGGEETDEDALDLPTEATVEIGDDGFDPVIVHIASGGSVTWENAGDRSYRIDSFQFHSGSSNWRARETLEPGESFTHTFESEGRYDFTDQSYGQFVMCGRVRVGDVDEGDSLPCE